GCYQRSNGALRIVDTGSGDCRAGEAALDWNVQGPPGPPSPPPANWAFVHSIDIPAGVPTEVARMDVGAGSWVFTATVHMADMPPGGAAGSPHTVGCNLVGTGGSASIGGDAPLAEIPLLWAGTLSDPTTVTLVCTDRGSDDDRVAGGTLTAVQVT